MIRDLRHAVRLLLHSKGWTLVVVVSLALGIGANTAIFGAVDGLLLRTLPVAHPESLVRLRWSGDNDMLSDINDYGYSEKDGDQRITATFSYELYRRLRASTRTLADVLACAPLGRVNVVAGGDAEIATGLLASGNYFQLLGVPASLGRTLTPEDDRAGAPPVAVLSYGYWMRRFGGDPQVIGTLLRVNTVAVTVVGVAPPSFAGVQQTVTTASDITMPVALDPQFNFDSPTDKTRIAQPNWWWLQVIGRLKPGVAPEQVEGELGGVFDAGARDGWASYLASLSDAQRGLDRNQNRTRVPHLRVSPGSRGIYDVPADTYRSLELLSAVVGLVLLIVCANIANLLLSRAAARRREISVRVSLGATRTRLVRQLLTESVLLAAVGAGVGLLFAAWGRRLLPANLAPGAANDWRLLAFVSALTVGTAIVFGLAPAWRSTDLDVGVALKDGGRSASAGPSQIGRSLVVAQVAISVVLLVAAGLFLRTVRNLRQVDVGFDARNLLLVTINPALNRYDQARIRNVEAALLDRLPAVPGVLSATLSTPALLSGSRSRTGAFIEGRSAPQTRDQINVVMVAPNFFSALGIPLVGGRAFTLRDNRATPNVVVLNQAAVRKYFPHENPLGRHMGSTFETSGQREIVGIVRDAKYDSMRDAAPPTMYQSYLQAPRLDFRSTVEARTVGDPMRSVAAVRDAIRQVDPDLAVLDVSTQTDQIEARFAQEKLFAESYALVGGLAVAIASLGLFGLMSYSVARRTNEIGIRMALGAAREAVVGMVMRESLTLVVAGVVIGIALALVSGRLISSLLFDLAPHDPAAIVGAAGVLVAVSTVAGYLPARTAARVDPMVALRNE